MELFKDIMTAVSNFKLRASEWGKKKLCFCMYIHFSKSYYVSDFLFTRPEQRDNYIILLDELLSCLELPTRNPTRYNSHIFVKEQIHFSSPSF